MNRYWFGIEVAHVDLGRNLNQKVALIVIRDSSGRFVVHPLTNIVFEYWKGKDYNTQKTNITPIIKFLNWLLKEENRVRIRWNKIQLSKLHPDIVSLFLNDCCREGLLESTVRKYEKSLTIFMNFLMHYKILDQSIIDTLIHAKENNARYFEVIRYNRENSNQLHELQKEFIIPFIRLAQKETNIIALGVYYQVMGGLRVGEVVNLRRDSVSNRGPMGLNGQVLDIKDNFLRMDIKDSSGSSQVKKPRQQIVFPCGNLLKELYEQHLENYYDKSGSNALFVGKNGLPMTGANYRLYFNKLKDVFIDKLIAHSDNKLNAYGVYLSTKNWSTHIGRGMFSNMLNAVTNNPLDIMHARGDKAVESSLTYMENSESMVESVQDIMEMFINQILENFW